MVQRQDAMIKILLDIRDQTKNFDQRTNIREFEGNVLESDNLTSDTITTTEEEEFEFCYHCGHELKEKLKKCPNCGKQL